MIKHPKFNAAKARAHMGMLVECNVNLEDDPNDPAAWFSDASYSRWLALQSACDGDLSGLSAVPSHLWSGEPDGVVAVA